MTRPNITGLVELLNSDDQGKLGELPKFAWPGGYTMFYINSMCDAVLCAPCATTDLLDYISDRTEDLDLPTGFDPPTAYGVIGATEDPPEDGADLTCDNCAAMIYQGEMSEAIGARAETTRVDVLPQKLDNPAPTAPFHPYPDNPTLEGA